MKKNYMTDCRSDHGTCDHVKVIVHVHTTADQSPCGHVKSQHMCNDVKQCMRQIKVMMETV